MAELLDQIRSREEELEMSSKRLEVVEAEKSQLLREIGLINQKIDSLESRQNIRTQYEEVYVADLQAQLDASTEREEQLQAELEDVKRRGDSAVNYPVTKIASFGGNFKNVPADPQEKAVFFFRKLLRSESYRKALIWQKRYLSLLIFSYQASVLHFHWSRNVDARFSLAESFRVLLLANSLML